jgi:trehalose 6-phosphate synthase
MGAAACGRRRRSPRATEAYPKESPLRNRAPAHAAMATRAGPHLVRPKESSCPRGPPPERHRPGSAVGDPLGLVVLVHDLSFVERREATTRNLLLFAFFVLAVGAASVITLLAARLAWRAGRTSCARLRGRRVRRISAARARRARALASAARETSGARTRGGDVEPRAAAGDAEASTSSGERVVILANREPYIHERARRHRAGAAPGERARDRARAGDARVLGGLGRARQRLAPTARRSTPTTASSSRPARSRTRCGACGSARKEEPATTTASPTRGSGRSATSPTPARLPRRATGSTTSPSTSASPTRCASEVDRDDPIVLVQDYHFALAPRMIRERLPRRPIITFWHIPWPNAERFGICPWREELISTGCSARASSASTPSSTATTSSTRWTLRRERIDRERHAVVQGRAARSCGPTPSPSSGRCAGSTTSPSAECARRGARRARPRPRRAARRRRRPARLHQGHRGAPARGRRAARAHPELRGRFTFVQLAAPSRTKIGATGAQRARRGARGEINERWGEGAYRPIVLLRPTTSHPTVFATTAPRTSAT